MYFLNDIFIFLLNICTLTHFSPFPLLTHPYTHTSLHNPSFPTVLLLFFIPISYLPILISIHPSFTLVSSFFLTISYPSQSPFLLSLYTTFSHVLLSFLPSFLLSFLSFFLPSFLSFFLSFFLLFFLLSSLLHSLIPPSSAFLPYTPYSPPSSSHRLLPFLPLLRLFIPSSNFVFHSFQSILFPLVIPFSFSLSYFPSIKSRLVFFPLPLTFLSLLHGQR